jgi:starch synthase (maltosyl-transferring)
MKEISRVADGRGRVAIERVSPQIDCGQFPIKRVVGETVVVEADVFADGHAISSVRCFIHGRATRSGNRHP